MLYSNSTSTKKPTIHVICSGERRSNFPLELEKRARLFVPLLFSNLALEGLTSAIRQVHRIKAIRIRKEQKKTLIVDDTIAHLNNIN